MAGNNPQNFEIPQEMRDFAEKSVEHAKQAFDSFIAVAQHAVSTAEGRAADAHAGAKEIGELAMQYAERNMNSSFEFARKLLQARDTADVVALHSEFVKSQMTAFADQAKGLSGKAASMAKGPQQRH